MVKKLFFGAWYSWTLATWMAWVSSTKLMQTLVSIGCGLTSRPCSSATMAAAVTLACELAMWPDLGMPCAIWIESPMTWMSLAAVDSKFRKLTWHQRPLAFASPVCTASAPARITGSTFSTSAFTSSCTSNLAVRVFASTAVTLCWGRYSIMSPYSSFQARLNSGPFEVTSGLPSRISTLDFGLAFLKYAAMTLARSYGPGGQR